MNMAFTGHRPQKLGGFDETNETACYIKHTLAATIRHAYDRGYRAFICGGALGVDTWAAEAVIALRDKEDTYPEMRLIVAVPCTQQDCKWPSASQGRYRSILQNANQVALVPIRLCMDYSSYMFHHTTNTHPYNVYCMQERNIWMVNHANCVVAVWDGTPGGTNNCIKYAKDQGKLVLRIHPDHVTRKVEWLGDSYVTA